MKRILGSLGFSIAEVLVATMGAGILMFFMMSFVVAQLKELHHARKFNSFINGKLQFISLLQNQAAWINTYNHPANTSLQCQALRFGEPGSFILKDAANNDFYDALNFPSRGFTNDFQPCNTFSPIPGSGDDLCPYRINLTWEPICNSCSPATIKVKGQLVYNASTASSTVDLSKFEFEMIKEIPRADVFIKDIYPGMYNTCAVLSDGSVQCWGSNDKGQLGDGTTTASLIPVTVSLPGPAKTLTIGGKVGCAALVNGDLYCWGANEDGQLGVGDTVTRLVPTLVPLPAPVKYVNTRGRHIDPGGAHTCALLTNGQVYCWGENNKAALGVGFLSPQENSPVAVAGVVNAVSLGICPLNGCVVTSDHLVKCWGEQDDDKHFLQATVPANHKQTTPVVLNFMPMDPVQVECSANDDGEGVAGYVRTANGQIYAWGENRSGLLGNGTTTDSAIPILTHNITEASYLFTRSYLTCITETNGNVKCWGRNEKGQTGSGEMTVKVKTPITVPLPGPASKVRVSPTSACAQLRDNKSYCWGDNSNGELGDGTTIDRLIPVLGQEFHQCL